MSLMTFTVYTTGVYGNVSWYNFNTKQRQTETFSGGDQVGPYNCDPSYGLPTVTVSRILTGYTTPQVWTFSPGSTYTYYSATHTETIAFSAQTRTLTISATQEAPQYTYFGRLAYSPGSGKWSDQTSNIKYGDTESTTTEASSGDVYCTVWNTSPTAPEGYTFVGWKDNNQYTGDTYESGDPYTIEGCTSQSSTYPDQHTMYAYYVSNTHTVTLYRYINGTYSDYTSFSATHGDTLTMSTVGATYNPDSSLYEYSYATDYGSATHITTKEITKNTALCIYYIDKIQKFYFGGVDDANDATFINTNNLTTTLTATMWNNFQDAIYAFGQRVNASITKQTVSSNSQMMASTYNNTITQLNKIKNKIGSSRSAPSTVTSGTTVVRASHMTGSSSIKAYYNGLVDDYYP